MAGQASSSWSLGASGFVHNITVPNLSAQPLSPSQPQIWVYCSGLILCAVSAQILIPAAHLEDVTEGGLPLTQARTSSCAMREHALQRSLELSLRVALMPSLAHRPRESPSSATQLSTKSDMQVAQLPCSSRAPIHLMLDPLRLQLCMSSTATTHSPCLTRARERNLAGWFPVIHKSCTSVPFVCPRLPLSPAQIAQTRTFYASGHCQWGREWLHAA